MVVVRFINAPGRFGPFRNEATARWWAQHECDGKQFTIIPVAPAP